MKTTTYLIILFVYLFQTISAQTQPIYQDSPDDEKQITIAYGARFVNNKSLNKALNAAGINSLFEGGLDINAGVIYDYGTKFKFGYESYLFLQNLGSTGSYDKVSGQFGLGLSSTIYYKLLDKDFGLLPYVALGVGYYRLSIGDRIPGASLANLPNDYDVAHFSSFPCSSTLGILFDYDIRSKTNLYTVGIRPSYTINVSDDYVSGTGKRLEEGISTNGYAVQLFFAF